MTGSDPDRLLTAIAKLIERGQVYRSMPGTDMMRIYRADYDAVRDAAGLFGWQSTEQIAGVLRAVFGGVPGRPHGCTCEPDTPGQEAHFSSCRYGRNEGP